MRIPLEEYQLAGEWKDQVRAIFMRESDEDPHPPDGDGGQAFGPGQFHPATFCEYYGRSPKFPRSVTHTLVQAQIVAAASFFETHVSTIGLDLTVQAYNKGVEAVVHEGIRNPKYLAEFTENLQKVRAGVA